MFITEVGMTTSMSGKYEIIGGPSREELFDALRLCHEGRRTIFTIAPRHDLPENVRPLVINLKLFVQVTLLAIDDDSVNCWYFELYDGQGQLGSRLRGHINVTTRKGWVREVTEE